MATYYEIFDIQPTATTSEIEAALDTQYNHWRHLVTHYDRNIVNEANQKLQLLEEARATLTDPAKRAAYNSAMNLGGAIGGLADPQVQSEHPVVSPSRPLTAPQPASAPVAARMDAWVCPKCQTPNPVNTQYCEHCGSQIGVSCPSCNMLTRAAARFCSHCGVDVQKALQEKRSQDQAVEEQRVQQLLLNIQGEISQYQTEISKYESLNRSVVMLGFSKNYKLFRGIYDSEDGLMKTLNRFINFILVGLFVCLAYFSWKLTVMYDSILVFVVLFTGSMFLIAIVSNFLGLMLVARPAAKQRIAQLQMHIAELEQQARQIRSAPLSGNK